MKQLLRVLLVLTLVLAMAAPAFAEPEVTLGSAGNEGTVVEEGEFVESIPEKPVVNPDEIEPETPVVDPEDEKPQKPGKDDEEYGELGDDDTPGGDKDLDDEEYGELGDDDTPGGDKELGDPNAPKTDDEAHPMLWGVLCLAALAGLVGMFKARKRV